MSNSTRMPNVNNDEWTQAEAKAHDAAVNVGEMASHAASAVGELACQAAGDVAKKADDMTARAGVGIQGLSDRLGQNVPHAGMLGTASQAVVRSIHGGGEYLEGAKLTGMTEDIAHVVRRNPIPAVLIALGLGWFVGRSLRK
jgi:hypothetical protein